MEPCCLERCDKVLTVSEITAHALTGKGRVQEKFSLCGYELPLEQLTIYTANPPDGIKHKYFQSDRALFCIHPQILEMTPDDPYARHITSSHSGRKK
nr:hypothetical protein [uncultured Desulfobacter sp.]